MMKAFILAALTALSFSSAAMADGPKLMGDDAMDQIVAGKPSDRTAYRRENEAVRFRRPHPGPTQIAEYIKENYKFSDDQFVTKWESLTDRFFDRLTEHYD